MAITTVDDVILDIIKQSGPVTTTEIVELAKKQKVPIEKEYINSLLYGYYREIVVRDRNNFNVPTWRFKTQPFEAAKGFESKVLNELLKQGVVNRHEATQDYEIRNPRNRKTYHLDIAIVKQDQKYNIEIDGFDHIRADARLSIQNQIRAKGANCEIEIDWMDNQKSYVDFRKIDNKQVTKWCNTHLSWCITYHEELLWPHDITRNIWLIENGWQVMRLWNHEIQTNLPYCVKQIKEWIMV